ncbi:hypothetical protein QFC24_005439 [Naganishia onofrii]|uniref:Uncharacterized protein n=1 Tax=Naganishia onofrii TaxID=1851511 RepID=A0ACC2X935_9TREE|nr:hypothetical protein QFC24_005439 [Naganishia onofrii]
MMIDDAAERFRDAYGIDELTDPSALSQDSTHVFGRIISTPTDTGKPSDSSLLLESSRAMGNGKRTPLRFAAQGVKVREGTPGVAGFGWFPGCLVGLKGRNGGGGAFEVEEVIMPPPLEMERTPLPDMLAMQERTGGQPVEVMLAAGPYTLDADLEYAPFEALVEAAIRDRPDVLLLLGPFVDSAHPLLKVGDTDLTPVQLFREHISSRLTALMESSPGTAVILIPSVRDLISRHVAFPQTPLDKDPELGLPKRVRMLPNPAHFYVNETLFSVASIDVLFHLRKEEYFRRAEEADAEPATGVVAPKDAMAELCRHVLGQRSMYPLVPPPADVAGEVNLDLAHHELLQLDVAPDVLILPSRLKYFAKIVDSVVAMNPGYLTKGNTAGTYSKLSIHPRRGAAPPADREKDGEEVEHEVYDRARVDVYRI